MKGKIKSLKELIKNKHGEPLKEGITNGYIRHITATTLRAEPPKPIKRPSK